MIYRVTQCCKTFHDDSYLLPIYGSRMVKAVIIFLVIHLIITYNFSFLQNLYYVILEFNLQIL
jgi:hypothetical protein